MSDSTSRLSPMKPAHPSAHLGVHKKIGDAAGSDAKVPTILSTHPANDERIKALLEATPSAMEIYRAQDCDMRRLGLLEALSHSVLRAAALQPDFF